MGLNDSAWYHLASSALLLVALIMKILVFTGKINISFPKIFSINIFQKYQSSSPPRGSNSQPSDALAIISLKSLTLYPIELGGHVYDEHISTLDFVVPLSTIDSVPGPPESQWPYFWEYHLCVFSGHGNAFGIRNSHKHTIEFFQRKL